MKIKSARRSGDWTLFNNSLAFASAKFAYYHLLPHRDLMIRPLTLGTPDFERKAVESAYLVFAWLLRTLLGLSPKKAQESLDQTRTIFDAVDARLADGRRFLLGDRLTISDLAFLRGCRADRSALWLWRSHAVI
jgi:glutathione S-transferase